MYQKEKGGSVDWFLRFIIQSLHTKKIDTTLANSQFPLTERCSRKRSVTAVFLT